MYTAVNALKTDIIDRTKGATDQERIPYVLLLTDGEANRAYPNWYADLTSSSARGTELTGSGASGTAQISALTILTAAKLKDELSQAYKTYNGNDKEVVWFNVAFGLYEDNNLATAILKPELLSSSTWSNLVSVYTQLNTYTGSASTAYKKYGVGGTPGYQYAKDYIYFVSPTDLAKVDEALQALAGLVEAATQEKIIPFEPTNTYGQPLNLLVTDVLGDGMELKTAPKMQGTTGTVKSVSGTVTTYEFAGFETTVTYDSATREMKWMILPAEIPLIMFSDRKNPTPNNYSNPGLDPMQLTYTVGLKDPYESGAFYSNEYADAAMATARFIPMTENPFYYKDISEGSDGAITSTRKNIGAGSGEIVQSGLKSSNITGTAATSYTNKWVVEDRDSMFMTELGNNGRITQKMKIDKAPVSGSVPAGENATYQITVTNLTDSAVDNVIVADTLPGGLTFVSGSIIEGSEPKTSATFPYTISSVPANGSVVLTFQAAVPSGASIGTDYINKAQITSVNSTALTTPATVDSEKVTVANTFSPQVTTKFDGADYTGQTVTLWQGGESKYTLTASGSVHTLSVVAAGTYDIYVNGVNTGVQLSASDSNKEINYYSVSFYDGALKYDDPAAQIILSGGKAVSPAAPTKTGYTFDQWVTTSGGATAFDFDTPITTTTNVYAVWTPNTNTAYKVEHYQAVLDGSYPATATETDNLTGITGTDTAAAAKNYTGFTAAAFSQKTIAADGSTVVEIYYDRILYAVSYDANKGTGSLPSGGNQKYDSNVTVQFDPLPTRTGYTFTGWSTDPNAKTATYTSTSGGTTSFTMGSSDVTLYAVWNAVPTATDDSTIIQKGEPVTIPVLENDTDADGDNLTVTITGGPSHGTATVNPDGTVTYTPNPDYTGDDSFIYTVSDGKGGTDTATVTISVNAPPIAVNDTAVAPVNTPVVISVLANDTDADRDNLTIASVTQPVHGQVAIDSERYDKTVTYTPNPGFTGTDTFTYTVSDGRGGTDTATVTVTVTDDTTVVTNNAPNAIDDAATTPVNVPVTISVLINDADPNGDELTVVSVTEAFILDDNGDLTATSGGSLTINNGKTVTYTPTADFTGKVVFTYIISDGHGGTDTAKVTVTVYEPTVTVNKSPAAADDSASTPKNKPVTIEVLGNDTDEDGDDLTVVNVTAAFILDGGGNVTATVSGTVTINNGKTVTYTPAADFTGEVKFEYEISDGKGGADTAFVTVTVYGTVNTPPVAEDDSATTPKNKPVTITVLANDRDDDGDTLTITGVSGVANGTVDINKDGTVTFTPDGDYTGTGSFNYTISDGKGGAATAQVTIDIYNTSAPANTPPVAADDSASTPKNKPVTITVLANDRDDDGDTLTITNVGDPSHGTAEISADKKTVTYTPNSGYKGTDTFTYTVSDGNGGTDTATVEVTVYETIAPPTNKEPAAADDSAVTPKNTAVTIAVLANDTDENGDTLSVISVTDAVYGTVEINSGKTVTYSPATGFIGKDSFEYTISDGNGGTDTATVEVTVYETDTTGGNTVPIAADDSAATPKNKPVTIAVLANDRDEDGDTLEITGVSDVKKGTVDINGDGTITFTPDEDYIGEGSFEYTVSDGNGGTDTATVTIDIYNTDVPANNAPDAEDDSATTPKNKPVTIAVLANDRDANGDSLTITNVGDPGNGTVEINADGTVTYTPNTNYIGEDSFTYTVSDGTDTATATVTVNVYNTANAAPIAENDNASTPMGKSVTIAVLANDTDADGDPLTVTEAGNFANGTATISSDGKTVTYTPNSGYKGTDTFTYTISDGKGGTDTATVTVIVYEATAPANTIPVAVGDTASTPTNKSVVIAVLTNDTDADGDSLTITNVSNPSHGTVEISSDTTTVTYTPHTNYTGTDTFTYTISDGNGGTDTAEVTVTVYAATGNTFPVAVDDNVVTSMNTAVVIPVLANDRDPDGDPLTITKINSKNNFTNGTVEISADKKTLTYVPKNGYTGTDTFTYTISDGKGGVATATVTVRVNVPAPHNNKPHAIDDDVTTPMNTTKVIEVLTNDTDADSDPLTVTSVTQPQHGTVTISADQKTVTYEPDPDYEGEDTFTYTISDGKGGTDTATVKLLVGTHVVRYDANGGSGSVPSDGTRYKNNETVQVLFTPAPSPPNPSYIFMGWSKSKDTLAEYTVDGTTALTMETSDITLYAVWSKCIVTLVANPKTIVGNGTSWTTLTATVTDVNGNPVPNVEVEFGASQYAAAENFRDGTTATTDADGKAVILYYSSNLETDAPTIFAPVVFRITATVNDIPKELHAQDWFDITFEPATLRGVLNEKITHSDGTESLAPITNMVVTISGTRSGYSWSTTVRTDAEGKYSTFVPWSTGDYVISYDRTIKTTDSNGKEIETNLTYTQNGTANGATGTGGTFDGDKTIVGIVLETEKNADKTKKKLIDVAELSNYNVEIYSGDTMIADTGLQANGVFNVASPQFTAGGSYQLVVTYTDPNHPEWGSVVASIITVTIDEDGVMNFSEALIDPYGNINEKNSDGTAGKLITDATVTLYYSNNKQQVVLPSVPGFAPADNKNPQGPIYTFNGFYAFMVFPNTDYYIVATAPGYETYISPTLHVGKDILRHDILMTPLGSGGSGRGSSNGTAVTPTTNPIDLAVAIQASSMRVIEGDSVTLTITYKNKSAYDADDVYVTADVPSLMSFVSAENGGTLTGSTVKWSLGTLPAGQEGTVTFVLKAGYMNQAEDYAVVMSAIGSNVKLNLFNLEDDTSFVKLKLFSINTEHKHDRYIKGYPDNTVKPLGNITRAEIAAIFARIMDLEGTSTHTDAYSDIAADFWAAEYIETVSQAGVMKGYANGTFKPDQPITRAELATVIARYLGIVRETNLDQFLDLGNFSDTSGSWARQTINELFRYTVVSGYADGSFKPDQNITRAEAIKMINRMMYRGPLTNVEPSFPDCTQEKWYFGDMEESIRTHKYTLSSDGTEIMTEYIEESLW